MPASSGGAAVAPHGPQRYAARGLPPAPGPAGTGSRPAPTLLHGPGFRPASPRTFRVRPACSPALPAAPPRRWRVQTARRLPCAGSCSFHIPVVVQRIRSHLLAQALQGTGDMFFHGLGSTPRARARAV
ncbi:hypothetical protein G6F50_017475 [Rhizopus delemar]|uniref:Uncharacterized protein n=1 Tax=Rhizopus delemar TaxID=936053 RepID=A0A9P6XQ18_9FUNG|nr:hypothetical protein G6F50_017475 [Rhizopus delemar]